MKLDQISITCTTQNQPAPYAYQQRFDIELDEDQISISFLMEYLGREDLTDEDIYEEGFTSDDDYSWKGQLPASWALELERVLGKTSYRKKQDKDTPLSISIDTADTQGSIPSEYEMWEYLTQELAQAIFEASGRELPLKLEVLSIAKAKTERHVIQGSFAERSASIIVNDTHKTINWMRLKSILKTLFLPDYLPELASDKLPRKRGIYISPEEGAWYKLGHAIIEPSKKSRTLTKLEELVEELNGL